MKFNLALVPITKQCDFLNLAQSLDLNAAGYVLANNSLPHITLYQFDMAENLVSRLVENIRAKWRYPTVSLTLDKFSCLTFDNKVNWVSLLPDKMNLLNTMHQSIAEIIGHPVKPSFDPHLTLANTEDVACQEKIKDIICNYVSIEDEFILALGYSDELGQFTRLHAQIVARPRR